MASSSYSWENRGHSWEEQANRADDFNWDSSDDENLTREPEGAEAGNLLIDFLMTLHYEGKLSARSVCVICWYASKAGALGEVGNYGFRPNAPTGHCQRHLDSRTGINMKAEMAQRYNIGLPMHAKHDDSRTTHDMVVEVPHEALNEEVLEDPTIVERARQTQWPPAYHASPIVQKYGNGVVPLALYLDGVPTTSRDGVLGIFIYSLVTFKRHLVAAVRKSSLCKCGCRGWCTLNPIWNFVHWSLQAMGRGEHPSSRHDNYAWKPSDSTRCDLGGLPLAFRGMLLQIRGDWLEFCSSLGLANWQDSQCPCIFCSTTKATMDRFSGFSPLTSAFPPVTHVDYDAACTVCEQKRSLNQEEYNLVKNNLAYFKTKDGPRGRALVKDLPTLGLERHDRLEPSHECQDIGAAFDSLGQSQFPVTVVFWRKRLESRCRHRCPLFDPKLGITLAVLCVDVLHGLWLGPAKDWCASVLWCLIDYNVFGVDGPLENQIMDSVLQIKAALWDFYKRWRQAHPGQELTELENLTPGMLGKNTDRKLATKAAETKHLVPFCLEMISRYSSQIPPSLAAQYRGIGESMQALASVMQSQGFVMAPEAIQSLYDQVNRLLCLWQASKLAAKPKLHQLMHLCDRAAFQGNPAHYATWNDESLNRVLGILGRSAHRTVWECRILCYFKQTQIHAAKKKRRF